MPLLPISRFLATATVSAVLGFAALTTACSDSTTSPAETLVYGPSQNLGQGTARTYAIVDRSGTPISVGVALSENALKGLPLTPMPGMPMAAMLNLALPDAAKAAGYDHATLDWNPNGHEPDPIYGLPHFDFHFYTISETAQSQMTPADPQFEAKLAKAPAAEFRPATYFQSPGGVPMMGAHWLDPQSPELAPNAPTGTFTRTFIYGSYDGHFIFYEPMITKAALEGAKTQAAASATRAIPVPAKYEKAGAYPTRYTMAWEESTKEYRVSLDGLVRRP